MGKGRGGEGREGKGKEVIGKGKSVRGENGGENVKDGKWEREKGTGQEGSEGRR